VAPPRAGSRPVTGADISTDDSTETPTGAARQRVTDRLGRLGRLSARYAPGERRPLGGYLAALATFGTAVAGLSTVTARHGGPPERLAERDLVTASIAVFRASRLLTSASVTAPLRAPFVRYDRPAGAGEVHEEVAEPEGGHRHAVGELVSCPYCLGAWLATVTGFGLVLAPRWTRLATAILTIEAGADALQKLYSDLQAR
jgi:hypothetical protein